MSRVNERVNNIVDLHASVGSLYSNHKTNQLAKIRLIMGKHYERAEFGGGVKTQP